jgi:predicted acetyltransferase
VEIKIEPIMLEQKSVFVQLMNLYDYDFTEFDDRDINEYGYFGYSYTDYLWTEGGRHPFFIRVDGKIAGFIIVKDNSTQRFNYIDDKDAHSINEFFVMKKYRRTGIGTFAAQAVFDKFKGKWEICQMPNNIPARKFWKSIISEYTQNDFQEFNNDNAKWVGFTFNNTR